MNLKKMCYLSIFVLMLNGGNSGMVSIEFIQCIEKHKSSSNEKDK